MKKSIHKKFILKQSTKDLDPKIEIGVLEELLKQMELNENYEMAGIIYNRIERIKSDGTQGRS